MPNIINGTVDIQSKLWQVSEGIRQVLRQDFKCVSLLTFWEKKNLLSGNFTKLVQSINQDNYGKRKSGKGNQLTGAALQTHG